MKPRASVTTASGVKISIRHEAISKRSVIVVAPGFFQSKETGTFRKIEADLSEDFDVISMDFRGHGKSGGLYTFSALEKEDLKAVLDYARTHYEKVGVLGFSYGGTIAILEQAEYRNADSLVCVSSPMAPEKIEFKWWTLRSIRLGLSGLERGAGVRPGNPSLAKTKAVDVVARVSPAPILFVHGDEDPTVSHAHSEGLYRAAREPKALEILRKASHAEEIYRQDPERFIALVSGWFGKTLGAKVSGQKGGHDDGR